MKRKVTIELTPGQKKQIKDETGKELSTLEFDALEDRDAPKGQLKKEFPGAPQ